MRLFVIFYIIGSIILINYQINGAPNFKKDLEEYKKYLEEKSPSTELDKESKTDEKSDKDETKLDKDETKPDKDEKKPDKDETKPDKDETKPDKECLDAAKKKYEIRTSLTYAKFMNCDKIQNISDIINDLVHNAREVTTDVMGFIETDITKGIDLLKIQDKLKHWTDIAHLPGEIMDAVVGIRNTTRDHNDAMSHSIKLLHKNIHACWYPNLMETNDVLKEKILDEANKCTKEKEKNKPKS